MWREVYLFLVVFLFIFVGYAQMGVGTDMPDPAAELEVKANNRGLLIPRVSLTDNTDETTITAGNVESLLVYNTSSNGNLIPGFYYWYDNMWKRLSDENNLPDNVVIWDDENNQFTYIDSTGETHEIDISLTETLTGIIDNEDGTISYFDEEGEETIINYGQEGEQGPVGPPGAAGQDGTDGQDGLDGKSAYELAVENGFNGSEQDWLDSLEGAAGEDGTDGQDGLDGKSAYEVAVENGFNGSEQDWLDSLEGAAGENGIDGADGIDGQDGADGQDGIDGEDGKSAYEVALENGFNGSEQDWLDSLEGEQGEQGPEGEFDPGELEDIKLEDPLEFFEGDGKNSVLEAMKIGISPSDTEGDILMTTADGVEWSDAGNLKIEPWYKQETSDKATENTDDIYQKGNVAIGKTEDFIESATLDVAGSIAGGKPDQNEDLGENSIAVGDGVIASENNTMAIGYKSEATAYGAFAGGGFQNSPSDTEQVGGKASGRASFAYGRETEAEGDYSVAFGYKTKAQKIGSVVFGRTSYAQADYSFVSGRYTRARYSYETVFGRYNAFRSQSGQRISQWNEEDPLFEIGNGSGTSSDEANNALTILKNAWTGIGIIGGNNDAKPTEMLDIGGNPEENADYEDLHKVRVRDLPRTDGNINSNKIVTVDSEGILHSISAEDLNDISSGKIQNSQNFSSKKEIYTEEIITNTTDKKQTYYLPDIIMPTRKSQLEKYMSYDIDKKLFAVDLYQLYHKNFVGLKKSTTVSSPGAPEIPNISKKHLHYYILYFDDQIYQEVNINEEGILTYKIKNSTANSSKRAMNLGFKIKKQ